ncbi:MAG: hypothetical protein OXN17_21810 [Candidatus Poribacteria bacterium]|nr:hypothetical protein [Candidatus Poribacteria bacterium]MDE0503630.1 hypothetical protein [Candidatus Poribacteria bacterium]
MPLLRKFIILALIVVLTLIAVMLILPIAVWVFQFVATVLALLAIGLALVYLIRKLRT